MHFKEVPRAGSEGSVKGHRLSRSQKTPTVLVLATVDCAGAGRGGTEGRGDSRDSRGPASRCVSWSRGCSELASGVGRALLQSARDTPATVGISVGELWSFSRCCSHSVRYEDCASPPSKCARGGRKWVRRGARCPAPRRLGFVPATL